MNRSSLLLLFSSLISSSSAWVNPAVPPVETIRRRMPTVLAAKHHADGGETSRRRWFGQVTSAAVALTSAGSSATAATTTLVPEKPVSPSLCDSAVSVWAKDDRRITLLGTAHISSLSAELAGQLVRDTRPDAVFVELDAKRVGRAGGGIAVGTSTPSEALPATVVITTPPPPPSIEATPSLDEQQAPVVPQQQSPLRLDLRQRALQAGSAAVGNAIKGMYTKLNQSGFNAGEEFAVAVREGQRIGSAIVLGDQDVEVTLRRLTEALAQTDLKQLMSPDSELEKSMKELMPGPPPSMDMSDATFRQEMSMYVETMKAKENVRKVMGELRKAAPAIYQALVAERDVYMAKGLDSLNQFPSIVAVMGIAHMEGIENTLQSMGWRQVPLKCPR